MEGLNKFLNLIIVSGCVVFAVLFWYHKTEKNQPIKSIEQSSINPNVDPQELANKYLQEAQTDLTRNKLKAAIDLKKAIAEGEKIKNSKITDPSKVGAERQIWKESQTPSAHFPDVRMIPAPQSDLDKKEYIRQFKENARKNGYEITVSDDLEVTEVVPIRKPQNQQNDYDSNSEENEY